MMACLLNLIIRTILIDKIQDNTVNLIQTSYTTKFDCIVSGVPTFWKWKMDKIYDGNAHF